MRLHRMVGLGVGVVLAIGSWASADTWVQWSGNGHYYLPVSVPEGIDWFTARDQAEALGGYLATIHSETENEFVFGLVDDPLYWNMLDYTMGPWIGGYQPPGSPEPDGGWTWVTGEPWDYENWYPGEPNNNPNENHTHYCGGWGESPSSGWNDARAMVKCCVSLLGGVLPEAILELAAGQHGWQ